MLYGLVVSNQIAGKPVSISCHLTFFPVRLESMLYDVCCSRYLAPFRPFLTMKEFSAQSGPISREWASKDKRIYHFKRKIPPSGKRF